MEHGFDSSPRQTRIIVGHGRCDAELADELVVRLQAMGSDEELRLRVERAELEFGNAAGERLWRVIEHASAVILLVSADTLNSDFIEHEKVRSLLLRRRREDGLHVLPVIVRSCAWEGVGWLKELSCSTVLQAIDVDRDRRPVLLEFSRITKSLHGLLTSRTAFRSSSVAGSYSEDDRSATGGSGEVSGEADWEERILEELTKVIYDGEQAVLLASRAGLPKPMMPAFKTPILFWTQVVEGARAGMLRGGVRPIVESAAWMFPGNRVFAEFHRQHSRTPVAFVSHQQPEVPRDDGRRFTVHLLRCVETDDGPALRFVARLRNERVMCIRRKLAEGPIQISGVVPFDDATELVRRLQDLGAIVTFAPVHDTHPGPQFIRSRAGLDLCSVEIDGHRTWACVYPITRYMYRSVLGESTALRPEHVWHPVTNVSWPDVETFRDRLNTIEGPGCTFRVPTEPEWRMLAASLARSLRDETAPRDRIGWLNAARPTRVGSQLPDTSGLHDLLGNVAEWTSTEVDGRKFVCGGSFRSPADPSVIEAKTLITPDQHLDWIGFRLIRDV